MTRKTLLIVVGLMAVVGLTFGFATTGLAYSGISYAGACSGCHTGAATNPVATLVSNNGTTATYNVSSGGTEWALFNGSTRVTGAAGATGQFVVPVPGTYTLFAVAGTVGGGSAQGLGQTAVVVSAPLSQFTITATAGSNGSIDPEGAYSATQGTNVKFTFTPNSGYHVADVTVDGTSIGSAASHTFTNVQATHTIVVSFAANAPTQLATSLSFRASTHTIRSGRYVTLYAKLSGGTFTNQSVRFEVKMPGARGYGLIRTVRVTAAGYAHIHLKVGAKGTRYLRARFTGDATHLAAPLHAGWKLVVK